MFWRFTSPNSICFSGLNANEVNVLFFKECAFRWSLSWFTKIFEYHLSWSLPEEGMIEIENLWYDADANACLVGAYYGYDAIPERWKTKVMNKDLIEGIAIQLYKNQK